VASEDRVRFLARIITFDLQRSLGLTDQQTFQHWLTTLTNTAKRLAPTAQGLRRQLPSIVQGSDSVLQFYERLRALRAQDPDAITEDQLADQFDLGLNPEYQLHMAAHTDTDPTLESLLDIALRIETKLAKKDTIQQPRPHTLSPWQLNYQPHHQILH